MATRECPLCGGKVSRRNKHHGAVCSSCMGEYKHMLAPCQHKNMSPMGMVRGDAVFCCRCKGALVRKTDKEKLAVDIQLAEKLGIMKKEDTNA